MADNVKHLVRVCNTDLNGSKPLAYALRKIKGVGFSFANAVCVFAKVDNNKVTGTLSPQEVERLEKAIRSPDALGIPSWMVNRRKDYDTGEDTHLISADLKFQEENDIKMMKKVKSYKGLRHMKRLPVRGQKTKSNFRNKKKKGQLGVQRKK